MKCKIGDIVEVSWVDAQGFINAEKEKVKICKVKNIGKLIEDSDEQIVLMSGEYPDEVGDYTAIPKGWQESMRLIEKSK